MATQKHLMRRLLIQIIGLTIAAWIVFLILAPSSGLEVRVNTRPDGTPTLCGVSLANTNLRNAAFSIVHFLGGRAVQVAPSGIFTNPLAAKNMGDTYVAMKHAGISTETPTEISTDIWPRLIVLLAVMLIVAITVVLIRRRVSKRRLTRV